MSLLLNTDDAVPFIGKAIEGAILGSYSFDRYKKEKAAFKAKYNKEPDAFNAYGYDTVILMGQVMNQFGFEREQIHQGLAKVKDVPSVIFGKTTFATTSRRVSGAMNVELVVKDGRFQLHQGSIATR